MATIARIDSRSFPAAFLTLSALLLTPRPASAGADTTSSDTAPSLDLNYVKIKVTDQRELTYDLLVAKTEVTNEQYLLCVQLGGCGLPSFGPAGYNWELGKPLPLGDRAIAKKMDAIASARPMKGRERHPVNGIFATDARRYCEWAGASLPSSIEWDAIAAVTGTPWPQGELPSEKFAHIASEDAARSPQTTAPVCSKQAGTSKDGLCDLWGNVWEWTETVPKLRMPPGQSLVGDPFVIRGGGFGNTPKDMLDTRYLWSQFATRDGIDKGFRCVIRRSDPIIISAALFTRNKYLERGGDTECRETDAPSSETIRDCMRDCESFASGACTLAVRSVLAVDAVAAFRTKFAKAVIPNLTKLCESRNEYASCAALADWHMTAGNTAEAAAIRERANAAVSENCARGDGASCLSLADSLAGKPEAVAPLTAACKLGVDIACMRLGSVFMAGIGTPPDRQRAREAFVAACRLGLVQACHVAKTLPARPAETPSLDRAPDRRGDQQQDAGVTPHPGPTPAPPGDPDFSGEDE